MTNQPLRHKKIIISIFLMLVFSANLHAGEAFFLSNGNLKGFDGKASQSAFDVQKDASGQGPYQHLFDWKQTPATKRFLLSKNRDNRFKPGSDAPSGFDLWSRDDQGIERQLDASVYRARFAADGQTLAYTTSDCELRIEDPQGKRLRTISGAYNPSWKNDGRAVLFEKISAGRQLHMPETLRLAKLDVASGKVDLLTDGSFDDVRPEFHPSGNWILFVSGGRSGLASFWKISAAGGNPEQVTNLGLKQVDENFIPTPYQKTIWSADGRWFLYDFKNGETRQTWGLEFNDSGKLWRAIKLADGLSPQWLEDGKTFAYLKYTNGLEEPAEGSLP